MQKQSNKERKDVLKFAYSLHTFPETPKMLETYLHTQEVQFSTLLLNENAAKCSIYT